MNDVIRPMPPSISNGSDAPASPRVGISHSLIGSSSQKDEASRTGQAQHCALRQQRFAIITVYSLAILLALGYVPGFGL